MPVDRPTVPTGEAPWAPSWWEEHRSDVFVAAVLVAGTLLLFLLLFLFVRRRLPR